MRLERSKKIGRSKLGRAPTVLVHNKCVIQKVGWQTEIGRQSGRSYTRPARLSREQQPGSQVPISFTCQPLRLPNAALTALRQALCTSGYCFGINVVVAALDCVLNTLKASHREVSIAICETMMLSKKRLQRLGIAGKMGVTR
jgi:hypothetical protein